MVFLRPPLENFALPWKKVCGRPCKDLTNESEKAVQLPKTFQRYHDDDFVVVVVLQADNRWRFVQRLLVHRCQFHQRFTYKFFV